MTRAEILAIAKPILFSTEMTKAVLDNRKTVTRRVIKPHNKIKATKLEYTQGNGLWVEDGYIKDYSGSPCWVKIEDYIKNIYKYQVGDYLYVRETYCWCPCWDCGMYTEKGCQDNTADRFYNEQKKENGCYGYKASFETGELPFNKWIPSIHMPKEAARIFMRVTDIRVERLQDITEEQAIKEGTMFFTPSKRHNQFHSKWLNGLCSDCEYANPFTLDGCLDMGRKLDLIESCGCISHFLLRNDGNSLEPARLRFFAYLDSLASKTNNFDMFHTNNPWVWVIEFERVGTDG